MKAFLYGAQLLLIHVVFSTCLSIEPITSCANAPCKADEECYMQQIQCFTTPCNPIAACRPKSSASCPNPAGVGTCVEMCSGDSQCSDGEKCCSNGCGHVCTRTSAPADPILELPNCPFALTPDTATACGFLCSSDADCNADSACCRNGCGSMCRSTAKPASCPTPAGFGACVEMCSDDSQCIDGEKCCSNGCGHVCTRTSAPANPILELPNCPFALTPDTATACGFSCSSDADCNADSACCRNGCGSMCRSTAPVKDGLCVKAFFARFRALANSGVCETDGNCPGDAKCCHVTFSGKTCTNPCPKQISDYSYLRNLFCV